MQTLLPEFKISLTNRGSKAEAFTIKDGASAAQAARYCFDADSIDWCESFIVIALNTNNKVSGFYKVSSGGMTGTVADPRVIFQFALLSNATALIIAHNHPSGNLNPSQADRAMTEKICNAGKLLDIKVIDHIIITDAAYYSFAESGELPY